MLKSTPMNTPDMPLLQIRLFGSFDASIAGQRLPPLRSRAEKWLLAILALRPGHPVSREWLAATLWPDSDTSLGLYNLRRCLSNLRKALGDQADLLLSPTPQTLSLDPKRVQVDVANFDTAIAQGDSEHLEQAVTLYGGPLLPECLEDWVLSARIEREQAYLAALETLAAQATAHRHPTVAVRYLRLTLAADPLRETAHGALMQALADCGDYAAVTQVYRDFRLLLHRELNGTPSAETEALYRRLQEQAKQATLPPAIPSSMPLRRLPVPLTTLVGREIDIADVIGWLQKVRLVTLLGSGGVGKTRLAIAAAEVLAPDFADGVWFVELASLSDPSLVVQAVARTLGMKEEVGRPLVETLAATLASRSLLLFLDNCEHLLDACATLAEILLSHCPTLKILATSREALGLMGEHRYFIPSLTLPPLTWVNGVVRGGEKDLSWLMEYGGMRLFVERAMQVQPAFRLSAQNVASVVGVVQHLDGIPLAIELAAARVRSLSIAEIQIRLHDHFSLLTGGSRTALPRQRTLRALIDWSYDLLTGREKRLLRGLSVFAGGWSLEAAECICAEAKNGQKEEDSLSSALLAADVLDVLTALVDKSLVIYEELGGEARYRLLETVRQYARERLVESGEATMYRRRHRDYFMSLSEEVGKKLKGPDQKEMVARLETDYDNLRQAMQWCLEGGEAADAEDGETMLRLGVGLYRFWHFRGHLNEGRECLSIVLARPETQGHTKARADVLTGAGRMAYSQGDYAVACTLYEEGLNIQRELEDPAGIANALVNLGESIWHQGDYASARSLHEEGLKIFRELGDREGIAQSAFSLGNLVWSQGDYVSARPLFADSLAMFQELGNPQGIASSYSGLGLIAWNQSDYAASRSLAEKSLEIRRELGDRHGIASSLNNLSLVAWTQKDYASARSFMEESLAIRRELGERNNIALALNNLGNIAWKQGDYASSRSLVKESMEIFRDLGRPQGIALTLKAFASLNAGEEEHEKAARMWGAAERLREEINSPLLPYDQKEHDLEVNSARAALGEKDFADAWSSGRMMTMEQAITYALEDVL